ncbi:MAG: putative toxin-antitoxin system toxin component, PIN family [Thermomicrobiales bacterium]|nr:putative toxin-antitoxin system toxin component, PIN family [Thermomicrobiales bacterium]
MINPRSAWGAIVFDYAPLYVVLMSNELEDEIRSVLERPSLTRKFDFLSDDLTPVLMSILQDAERVPLAEIPPVCRDPNDDKVIATAMQGNGQLIATEDKDLLDMGEYEGIRIVTGLELLRMLRE